MASELARGASVEEEDESARGRRRAAEKSSKLHGRCASLRQGLFQSTQGFEELIAGLVVVLPHYGLLD